MSAGTGLAPLRRPAFTWYLASRTVNLLGLTFALHHRWGAEASIRTHSLALARAPARQRIRMGASAHHPAADREGAQVRCVDA